VALGEGRKFLHVGNNGRRDKAIDKGL